MRRQVLFNPNKGDKYRNEQEFVDDGSVSYGSRCLWPGDLVSHAISSSSTIQIGVVHATQNHFIDNPKVGSDFLHP